MRRGSCRASMRCSSPRVKYGLSAPAPLKSLNPSACIQAPACNSLSCALPQLTPYPTCMSTLLTGSLHLCCNLLGLRFTEIKQQNNTDKGWLKSYNQAFTGVWDTPTVDAGPRAEMPKTFTRKSSKNTSGPASIGPTAFVCPCGS